MIDYKRLRTVFLTGPNGQEMYVKYDITDIPGYGWVADMHKKNWLKPKPKPEHVIMTCRYYLEHCNPSTVGNMIGQAIEDIERDLIKVARHLKEPPCEPDCGFGEACAKQGRMGIPKNEVPTNNGEY